VKIDVADYARPGEAPDLIPVRGKVTVFDFWAPWCVPCKTLDPALVEIAKKHPDLVAIRKLDVVDWDSKAAVRYLTPGGFDLPHLKIFDATGKRVLEKSSAPGKLQELIDSARTIVEDEAKRKKKKQSAKPVRIEITADARGFTPSAISVPRGVPVTLVFERIGAKNCASEVIIDADGKTTETKLPVGQRTTVTMTFTAPGVAKFACAMNMYRGTITVK
jgi:thiol-disulfide isomerase/thioredoxin